MNLKVCAASGVPTPPSEAAGHGGSDAGRGGATRPSAGAGRRGGRYSPTTTRSCVERVKGSKPSSVTTPKSSRRMPNLPGR